MIERISAVGVIAALVFMVGAVLGTWYSEATDPWDPDAPLVTSTLPARF